MSAIEHLQWRYAVRKFSNRQLSEEQLSTLAESVRLAPSAYGLQPYLLFVIHNRAIRQQLLAHSYGQDKVVNASHLFVLAHKTALTQMDVDGYIAGLALTQNVPLATLDDYKRQIEANILSMQPEAQYQMTKQQCFIALGTLLSTAAAMRIDTCPITGFDPQGINEVLGLTEQGLSAVLLCPVGYRADDDTAAFRPKYRVPKHELVVSL